MGESDVTTKTSAVETHVSPVEAYYGKAGEDFGPSTSGSDNQRVKGVYELGAPQNSEVVELSHAIEEIERKKTTWYAYLKTREFWFVLALG